MAHDLEMWPDREDGNVDGCYPVLLAVPNFMEFAGISCVYLPSTCTRCRNREGSILFFELDGWLESYSELTR